MSTTIPKYLPGTIAFVKQKDNPLPELLKSATLLEKAGADFIVMPCHTAHLWFNELKNSVAIPFYSIVENTFRTVCEQKNSSNKKILLLATSTTINSQLYQTRFKNSAFTLITPSHGENQIVDNAIHDIKAGIIKENQNIKQINDFLKTYKDAGISMTLGCCTEIPLMYPYLNVKMEMLDPTLMLAKFAVKKAT